MRSGVQIGEWAQKVDNRGLRPAGSVVVRLLERDVSLAFFNGLQGWNAEGVVAEAYAPFALVQLHAPLACLLEVVTKFTGTDLVDGHEVGGKPVEFLAICDAEHVRNAVTIVAQCLEAHQPSVSGGLVEVPYLVAVEPAVLAAGLASVPGGSVSRTPDAIPGLSGQELGQRGHPRRIGHRLTREFKVGHDLFIGARVFIKVEGRVSRRCRARAGRAVRWQGGKAEVQRTGCTGTGRFRAKSAGARGWAGSIPWGGFFSANPLLRLARRITLRCGLRPRGPVGESAGKPPAHYKTEVIDREENPLCSRGRKTPAF